MSPRPISHPRVPAVHHRGLSLIEVLIVLCLITVLAAVSLPMMTQANGQARSTACQANLVTLGQHLQRYEDSNGRFPALMNRDSASLDVPTLDQLFALPRVDSAVFNCPADDHDISERSGTSYLWHTAWDDASTTQPDAPALSPILSDKAPLHPDQRHPYNALFFAQGDGPDSPGGLTVSAYAMPR